MLGVLRTPLYDRLTPRVTARLDTILRCCTLRYNLEMLLAKIRTLPLSGVVRMPSHKKQE
jgi:hypothetical protein